ncbi:HYR domain-containing protein [Hyalangium versicolor]|uniref:HYR domain-containing protein n=1 Tax=Hyalangium versicolor TaxID=2861190 RepID=UPI001CCDDD6A|nr:HYR domain-containing protein [Hyalangium versicolor]
MASGVFVAVVPAFLALTASASFPSQQVSETQAPLCEAVRVLGVWPSDIRIKEMASAEGTLFVSLHLSAREELWRSDGTPTGTVLVKAASNLEKLTAAGQTLFFTESTPETGQELWKSDGTPEGTSLVVDLTPGAASTPFSRFASLGDTVFFTVGDANPGVTLWKSDGTADGTTVFKSFAPGISVPWLDTVHGRLVFELVGTPHGELWGSDGTEAGTHLLSDETFWEPVATTQDHLYLASSGAGNRMWTTDGTLEGTRKLERSYLSSFSIIHVGIYRDDQLVGAAGRIFVLQSFQPWSAGPSPAPYWEYSLHAFDPETKDPSTPLTGGLSGITSVNDQVFISASNQALFWHEASDGREGQVALPAGIFAPRRLFPAGKHLFFLPKDGEGREQEVWSMRLACLTDHAPPTIQCPERVVVESQDAEGAAVSYPPATATDDQSAAPEIRYDVPSGSLFPVGVTTVTATAEDELEQQASCSFEVEVRQAADEPPPASYSCNASPVSAAWLALLGLALWAPRRQ